MHRNNSRGLETLKLMDAERLMLRVRPRKENLALINPILASYFSGTF